MTERAVNTQNVRSDGVTEPARDADDVCPCGRPNHIDLIYQLRDALGLTTTAAPVPPKQVWEQTLEVVRQRTRSALAMLPPPSGWTPAHSDGSGGTEPPHKTP